MTPELIPTDDPTSRPPVTDPDAEPATAPPATDAAEPSVSDPPDDSPDADGDPGGSFEEAVLPPGYKAGYVAIVGEPNVGKSTLLNAMLHQKLSIVTDKAQTTRHRVVGILSVDQAQIIFQDTPGLLRPKYPLHEAMMRFAEGAIKDADVILLMVDVSQTKELLADLVVQQIQSTKTPVILAINKIDTMRKDDLLPMIGQMHDAYPFAAIVPISALKDDGLDRLLSELIGRLPEGRPFYPPDMISEHPERFFVSEIIREKVFELYRDEIPYATEVVIVDFREAADGSSGKDFVDAEIIVERDTQKGILIGKKGEAIKRLGQSARNDIETFLDRPVYLQLHVKVRENWRARPEMLRSFGYR